MTRIVDLSCELSGRYATRLLADYGWDVVAVELPASSKSAKAAADAAIATVDLATLENHLGRNKRILTLDYGTPEGRRALGELLAGADVLVHTFTPGLAARFGLGAGALNAEYTNLSVVSLTAYGHEGADSTRRATEKTLYAEGGGMLISGMAESRYPLVPNMPIVSTIGGIYGAISIVATLIGARSEGGTKPHHIDIALRDLLPISLERVLAFYTYMKVIPYRGARRERIDQAAGMGEFAAKDGDFHVFGLNEPYAAIAKLIGRDDLVDNKEWLNPHLRTMTPEQVIQLVADAVAKKTIAELSAKARELRIPSGPVIEVDQLEGLPQLKHRKALTRIADGLDIEEPYRFSSGERRREPLQRVNGVADIGPAASEAVPAIKRRPSSASGPLAGIRVLDLTHAYAGPSSTRILSDLGAEVIKVESVTRMDTYPRGILPFDNNPTEVWWERSGYFAERNLGKKAITLDMASPKGRELFVSLLDHVDVVTTNFTPRVMAGWGLGPAKLQEMKPGLVVLSMSGFGGTGPDSEKPALAGLIEASSGFTAMIRYNDSERPSDVGFSFGDMVSGLFAAVSTLIALDCRDRTGRGDAIDLSCCESPLAFLAPQLLSYARSGKRPSVREEIVANGRHVLIKATGDDTPERWILAFVQPSQEADFAKRVPGSDADGFIFNPARQADIVADLRGAGFAAAALTNAEELIFDAELKARQIFTIVDRPTAGIAAYSRAVPILADGRPLGRTSLAPPPRLGQHSAEIFSELLGLDAAAYEGLVTDHITGTDPVGHVPSVLRRPVKVPELHRRGRVRPAPDAAARLAAYFGYPLAPPAPNENEHKKERAS
jgi:crotonobetainyl-CoA:carnitine CoA-transferase CaiB-like acyl-CoA transferase